MGLLLFDIQQLFIANLAMLAHNKSQRSKLGDHVDVTDKGVTFDEGLLRHMVLNSIRSNKTKFPKYKDVVIASDGKSWRRDAFPEYKHSRKTTRDAQESVDWTSIFATFSKIRDELKTYFPYRVIYHERAEADDVIAQIVFDQPDEDILILSGDKDLRQLQTHKGVKQYDPTRKKFITEDHPDLYLAEHILRGDVSDGIPNVLSDNDCFVLSDKRQKPLTKGTVASLMQDAALGHIPPELKANYERNRTLIDLKCCPRDIASEIMTDFYEQEGKGRSRIFTYMVNNKLSNLMESISEF
jgi:hypothetical protein